MFCLDFEASSLNMRDSYPIEVAYMDGEVSYEAFILPHPDWDDWSWESQLIHNIPLKDLHDYGKPGPEICDRMNKDLAGQEVYMDGGFYDRFWCERLFAASDKIMQFRFLDLPLPEARAWEEFNKNRIVEHRALADARALWKFMDAYYKG